MSFQFLPPRWQRVELVEAGEWFSGGTPPRSEPSYWGGEIPWIGTKDLKEIRLVDASEYVTAEGAKNGTRVVPKGSILFAVRGMSLAKRFRVGMTTRAVAFNQDVKAIVPRSDILAAFLVRYLSYLSGRVLLRVETASHGTKRLPLHALTSLPVPIPPLAEQRRIAAILDRADAIRRKRRAAIALTEELLRSTFLDMFGDPVTNPKGWTVAPLGEGVDVRTGRTPSRKAPENFQGSVPWVKTTEVRNDIILGTEECISLDAASKMELFPPGSLVVAMYGQGATRGRTARLGIAAATNQACAVLLPNENIDSLYLWAFLRLSYAQLRDLGRGGNQPNLNLGLIRSFPVLRPPKSLQLRFSETWQYIQDSLRGQRLALAHTDTLFHALVQRAFRGDL